MKHDRCTSCHHERDEHMPDGCVHYFRSIGLRIRCGCKQFIEQPIPDRFNPVAWRP